MAKSRRNERPYSQIARTDAATCRSRKRCLDSLRGHVPEAETGNLRQRKTPAYPSVCRRHFSQRCVAEATLLPKAYLLIEVTPRRFCAQQDSFESVHSGRSLP